MSVAFRRESDEEHLEPKFELPIPPGPNLVTARGLALIAERVAALEAQVAAAPDDEARKPLQRDLRYWTARQLSAELAPAPAGDKVEFGTEVTINLRGAAKTFRLVGDDEGGPWGRPALLQRPPRPRHARCRAGRTARVRRRGGCDRGGRGGGGRLTDGLPRQAVR